MAEFLGQPKPEKLDGFAAMGHPIPFYRRQAGYDTCRAIGLDESDAYSVVSTVSEALAKDRPYEAMKAGCVYLDLTGTYRLFAVLLTHPPSQPNK